jgi:hypothetical protein
VPWAPPRPAAARATTVTTAAKFKARPEPRGSQHGAVLAGGRLMYGLSQAASTAPSQATATRGPVGGGHEGGPLRGSLPGPWESFPPPSQSQYGWEEQGGKPGGHFNPQVRHVVRLCLVDAKTFLTTNARTHRPRDRNSPRMLASGKQRLHLQTRTHLRCARLGLCFW